jgi:hypothetical protein
VAVVAAGGAAVAEHAGPDRGERTLNTSHQPIITSGRACVRLIEAADALLGYRPAWTEALFVAHGAGALSAPAARADRDAAGRNGAEILATSEKIEGAGAGVWTALRVKR